MIATLHIVKSVLLSLVLLVISTGVSSATLTLSRVESASGEGDVISAPGINNLLVLNPNTMASLGQTFTITNAGEGNVGYRITGLSIESQTGQTVPSNAVWTLTIVGWQPSSNALDMRFWTNGTDADSLAGFTGQQIVLRDSGSFSTNTSFGEGTLLKFTFNPDFPCYLETNRAYAFLFSVSNATNSFNMRARYPGDHYLGGVALQNDIGSPSTSIGVLDVGFYLDGYPVTAFNFPPIVVLNSPSVGAVLKAGYPVGLPAFAVDPDGGTIAKVEFYADGDKLGDVTQAPFTFTWTNTVAGAVGLTVKATDNAGLSATFGPVSVTMIENFHPLTIATPSQVQFKFYGVDGGIYQIQHSHNLIDWTNLTVVVTAPGGAQIIDALVSNNRFYRARFDGLQ